MSPDQAIASFGTGATVIYDGDCPFCSEYVRMTRLREAAGPVNLVNAREIDPETLAAILARYNLDEGMIFAHRGAVYWGADAIHAISLLSSGSAPLSRLTAAVFRHRALTRALYPLMRAGRNVTLALLRRRRIGRVLAGRDN